MNPLTKNNKIDLTVFKNRTYMPDVIIHINCTLNNIID